MKTSPLFVMGDMFIVPLRGDTLPVRLQAKCVVP